MILLLPGLALGSLALATSLPAVALGCITAALAATALVVVRSIVVHPISDTRSGEADDGATVESVPIEPRSAVSGGRWLVPVDLVGDRPRQCPRCGRFDHRFIADDGFECRRCGYQFTRHPGSPWPDVTLRPALAVDDVAS